MSSININVNEYGENILPYWKKQITAGRAAEGLRAEWRDQLTEVQREIGFEYIRFHGIFHDEMMIYNENKDGSVRYNWQYFDELFDYLLSEGLKPILELGFMPSDLASGDQTIFWWKGNVTPPKDYSKWADLVGEVARHSINRYGLTEVLSWYFEVWNEPNLGSFWAGTQQEYFKLYKYSVKGLKAINSKLRIGGPSSSGGEFREEKGHVPYVEALMDYCEKEKLPIDFITAHPYPTYWPLDTEGMKSMGYMEKSITIEHLNTIRNIVDNSSFSDAEIHLTEWNSSPSPRDMVHDTAFMAPFIIDTNISCLGLVDSLGFWTFTDIFEETAAGDGIFHGGFGLINLQGMKKASYYGYWFLSKLGNEVLERGDNYVVTRKDGKIQILMWNYCYYKEDFANGDRRALTNHDRYRIFDDQDLSISIDLKSLQGKYKEISYSFGKDQGSAYDVWLQNGAPVSPNREEIGIIEKETGPKGAIKPLGELTSYNEKIVLKPHEVKLIELIEVI